VNRRAFNQLSFNASIGAVAIPNIMHPNWGKGGEDSAIRIPKTDTHMHLFGLDQLDYHWLKNAPEINKTFLPEDFITATRKARVKKIVFMESGAAPGSSLKEVKWVTDIAHRDPRIKGIVAKGKINKSGAIDPPVEELLATGWVKGIRGGINSEILKSAYFIQSMDLLAKKKLSFDLLPKPTLLADIASALKKAPDTTFILDHMGNPDIRNNLFESWSKDITKLAEIPNLNCKISGIINGAGKGWTIDLLKPYVHHVIEQFGFDRIVYGGNWPVVLRAGSYLSWSRAFEELTSNFSKTELRKLYHLNANRIYQLTD